MKEKENDKKRVVAEEEKETETKRYEYERKSKRGKSRLCVLRILNGLAINYIDMTPISY